MKSAKPPLSLQEWEVECSGFAEKEPTFMSLIYLIYRCIDSAVALQMGQEAGTLLTPWGVYGLGDSVSATATFI